MSRAPVPLTQRGARALAAAARSFLGDIPLAGVGVATVVLSASIAASIPADAAAAPEEAKALLAGPLSTVVGVYAAVMAAIYGSFRYTIDRRTGVVAQRATLQPRAWALVGRIPFTVLGGALVGAAAVLGARLALAPTLGLTGLDAGGVGAILVVGAAAAVWGLGVGLLVQAHLPSLFAAPFSLSIAMVIAPLWPHVAAWFPLPMLLRGTGLDLTALGIAATSGPQGATAAALAAASIVAVGAAGAVSFLRRDLL